jgi:hypothetical protein
MTLLPAQAIAEFQARWKKHYGAELPREQAVVRAHQVFALIRLLADPPNAADSPNEKTRVPTEETPCRDRQAS